MRRRWQSVAVWAVIGLIPALGAGLPAWAQEQEPGAGDEMFLEGLETEPGLTAPGLEPSAPGFSAPAAVPPGQPQYRLHRVGKEENLHLLAAYYYGDARQWPRIYQLNKKKIKNANVIQEGQILKIDVPPGWQPRFSLPEFMDKERQRIAQQGLSQEERKPKIIREKEEVQLIPSLLPMEEEEGETGGEGKGEKKEMLTPSIGGVPGVEAPPPSPTPPEGGEGGGAEAGGGTGGNQ